MLFNEPKLLKSVRLLQPLCCGVRFSALQRAEIAEIWGVVYDAADPDSGFSALQRAEIAEIHHIGHRQLHERRRFSALQRAEIAEMLFAAASGGASGEFQCSTTSRNC